MKIKALATSLLLFCSTFATQASSQFTASVSNISVAYTGSFAWATSQSDTSILLPGKTTLSVAAADADAPSNIFLQDVPMNKGLSDWSIVSEGLTTTAAAHATSDGLAISIATPESGGAGRTEASWSSAFSLGPNASFTLNWDSAISGANTGETNFDPANMSRLSAYISVEIGNVNSDLLSLNYTAYPETPSLSFDQQRLNNSLTFNAGDSGLTTSVKITLYAWDIDHPSVTAVPEPQTWALHALGLCGIGFATRRRHRCPALLP